MEVLYYFFIFCLYVVDVVYSECRCRDPSDCLGPVSICASGCLSGWSGYFCDRRTTTVRKDCNCLYVSECYSDHGSCTSCQSGWTGINCDRRITHTHYKEDSSSAAENSLGYIALIITVAVVLFCCIAAGIRRRPRSSTDSTSRVRSSQIWRTAASAESQRTDPSITTLHEICRTDNGTSQQGSPGPQTDTPSHEAPPPSYESVMSRTNQTFQSTDSLPPYFSTNTESSEVIQTPPNYASVTSQYNENLQPSISRRSAVR